MTVIMSNTVLHRVSVIQRRNKDNKDNDDTDDDKTDDNKTDENKTVEDITSSFEVLTASSSDVTKFCDNNPTTQKRICSTSSDFAFKGLRTKHVDNAPKLTQVLSPILTNEGLRWFYFLPP